MRAGRMVELLELLKRCDEGRAVRGLVDVIGSNEANRGLWRRRAVVGVEREVRRARRS